MYLRHYFSRFFLARLLLFICDTISHWYFRPISRQHPELAGSQPAASQSAKKYQQISSHPRTPCPTQSHPTPSENHPIPSPPPPHPSATPLTPNCTSRQITNTHAWCVLEQWRCLCQSWWSVVEVWGGCSGAPKETDRWFRNVEDTQNQLTQKVSEISVIPLPPRLHKL